MSLWRIVKETINGEYEMKMFYDRKSLYEIRVKYAHWIEDRLTNLDSIPNEKWSADFLKDLEEHIGYSSNKNDFCIMCNRMKSFSSTDLVNHLRDGIRKEILLLKELTLSKKKNQLESLQEIIKFCNEFHKTSNKSYFEQKKETDQIIEELVDNITKIFQDFESQQKSVLDLLKNWHRKQIEIFHIIDAEDKIKMNKMQIDELNKIQNYFELLFDIIVRLLSLIEYLKKEMPNERLLVLVLKIKRQQEILIDESFIVDNQPKQIIKKCQSFSCSVRWLLGPKLGLENIDSFVQCEVVIGDEPKSKEFQTGGYMEPSPTSFQINEVKMEYQEQNRFCFANFKSLQIKKIPRPEKRRCSFDCLMDRKITLLFRMIVNTDNSKYIISKLSVPMVVIFHGSQERQALATIMWHNAFSEDGQDVLHFPDRVSWTKLADALNLKCFSETKRGLTDANRYFLYKKICPNMTKTLPEEGISRNRFSKEALQGYHFTFWEWFYDIIKLIKEHLLKPWQANLIEGFISKKEAETNLQCCRPGTFLMRFSDSIRGAITISYVSYNNQVLHIQPFTSKDLQNQCLANRIEDLINISELYPYKIKKNHFKNEFGGAIAVKQ